MPEIDKTYLLFKKGEFVGEGIWTNDKHNGPCFIETLADGVMKVYAADSWTEKRD